MYCVLTANPLQIAMAPLPRMWFQLRSRTFKVSLAAGMKHALNYTNLERWKHARMRRLLLTFVGIVTAIKRSLIMHIFNPIVKAWNIYDQQFSHYRKWRLILIGILGIFRFSSALGFVKKMWPLSIYRKTAKDRQEDMQTDENGQEKGNNMC